MEKKFLEICKTYHKPLVKYLYYKLGNLEDAQDISQEVFILVFDKIENLKEHENIGGFIFQTAKFKAQNFIRKRETSNKLICLLEKNSSNISNNIDLFDEILSMKDKKIKEDLYIEKVLDNLSIQKRRLYELYYVERKSYKEISKILNINEAAIRMKYMRLRNEIKKYSKNIAQKYFVIER